MREHRLKGAIAAAAVLTVLLGGCSDGDKPGADASASADVPTGDPTVETSDGGEVVTSGEVNDKFPDDQVPLAEGQVLSSASSPGNGFNVVVLVDGDPSTVSKDAVKQLKKAGFKVRSKRASGGGVVTVLRSPKFRVEVAATPSGSQTSLNYVVARR